MTVTRIALHQVAEHVLAAAQFAATGTIRLRYVPGGFGTTAELPGGRSLAVVNGQLEITDADGRHGVPLTTLRAAAAAAGGPLGLGEGTYRPTTPLAPDAPLSIDEDDARRLGEWYGLADAALRRFAPGSEPVIWPEHFDIGITVDAVNYGGSPGDAEFPDPYLYVGPPAGPPVRDAFWNADFGAALPAGDVHSVEDATAFFTAGRERAATSS